MRRILWTFAGAASAVAIACGSFGSDNPSQPPPAASDASVDAKPGPPLDAGVNIEIPNEALDSGAGSADATAATSAYGAAVLSDQPFAYWRMSLDEKGVVPNVVENGLALVPNDKAKVVAVDGVLTSEPKTNGALELKDGFLATAKSGLYDFAGSATFTVECWAKRTGPITGAVGIVSKATFTSFLFLGGVDGYALAFESDTSPTVFYGGATNVSAQGGLVHLDTWHHFAVVVDDDRVALFVDGEPKGSTNRALGSNPSKKDDTAFLVGSVSGTAPRFPGIVDEVALYDKALHVEQLKAHYDAANPAK